MYFIFYKKNLYFIYLKFMCKIFCYYIFLKGKCSFYARHYPRLALTKINNETTLYYKFINLT